MGIGVGIFLIALGAILTFAVDRTVAGVDLHTIGKVLMVAGVVGQILFFVFWNRRRTPQATAILRQPQVATPPHTSGDATPLPPATVTPVAVDPEHEKAPA
jgi:hypothetical protein